MLYAFVGKERVSPIPGARAMCPQCKRSVIAKTGEINVWHWAHVSIQDCDDWSEGETEWHASIKAQFPQEWVEQGITKDGVTHRADILTPGGLVIELQHTSISPEEIRTRENFYGRMLWLFDARDAYENYNLDIRDDDDPFDNSNYRTFRWKHARKSIAFARKSVYLDLGEGCVLDLRKFYPRAPSGGWGYLRELRDFLRYLR